MLKVSLRNILKTKKLSLIHIAGLAIAIATATILFLTAMFELSFDNFHIDKDRIGILYTKTESATTGIKYDTPMEIPLAPRIKEDMPGIESVSRYANGPAILRNGDKEIGVRNKFVDREFLSIFSFPFKDGSNNALNELNDIVITLSVAQNLFGSTDVIGKQLEVNNDGQWQAKTISAILHDIPSNSSLEFNCLMRFENRPEYLKNIDNWENRDHDVFVKLKASKIDQKAFAKETIPVVTQYYNDKINMLKRDGARSDKNGSYLSLNILPISNLHLNDFGIGESQSPAYPWILLVIATLILFIASSNFINLSLAHSITRNREIGTRKTLGGTTWDIVKQLWLEALILCLLGLGLGLLITFIILPQYNANMNYKLEISYLLNSKNLLYFTLTFLLITLIAGGLPAWKIADSNIIQSLKGNSKIKSSSIRNSLTILQFIIAITLIIATIVISMQLKYMSNKPLGFNKSEVISIPIGREIDAENALKLMRNKLQQQPWVKAVSASDINIGRGRDGSSSKSIFGFEFENKQILTNFMRVDYDYLKTLDIKLVAGRDFDRSFSTDSNAVIINKQMAAQFGETDKILGKKIALNGESIVIGVIDDFNFKDLKNKIEPLSLSINPNIFPVAYIFVNIQSNDLSETLKEVDLIWKTVNPAAKIGASYLDENTQNLYQSEKRFSKIIILGTSITIFISCLGLFALALMSINQRIKEIGIRKILGSSVSGIIYLLSKDFIKLILLAFLMAAPLAWWMMNNWLKEYAYRINIQWWMFALAIGVTVFIAWSTIAWQAFRAASANPVDSLRDE